MGNTDSPGWWEVPRVGLSPKAHPPEIVSWCPWKCGNWSKTYSSILKTTPSDNLSFGAQAYKRVYIVQVDEIQCLSILGKFSLFGDNWPLCESLHPWKPARELLGRKVGCSKGNLPLASRSPRPQSPPWSDPMPTRSCHRSWCNLRSYDVLPGNLRQWSRCCESMSRQPTWIANSFPNLT